MEDAELQKLVDMAENIDEQVKILANSKSRIYNKIADRLMDLHSEEIMDFKEVFALGTEVSHSPESSTSKKIKVNIEPAETFESVEEKIEVEKEIRDKIYSEFPDFESLRPQILIRVEGNYEE